MTMAINCPINFFNGDRNKISSYKPSKKIKTDDASRYCSQPAAADGKVIVMASTTAMNMPIPPKKETGYE